MEEMQRISLLLDFYGQLITEKQYSIMDMHYNSDYSLGELAEYLNISRQGVFDNIKRGKDLLERYEEKLNLVKKYFKHKKLLENVERELNSLDLDNYNPDESNKIKFVKNEIKALIDDLSDD